MIIKDIEIIVPDDKGLIKKLNSLNTMNLYLINRYQKEQRFYPNSSAGCEHYCLYLGSMESRRGEGIEKCDLWHYPYYTTEYPMYSTAIVVGNEAGDYRTGWPSLATKYDSYRTLLHREIVCGLVTEPKIIMELGLSVLELGIEGEIRYNQSINEATGGTESYMDVDELHDWWTDHWWKSHMEEKFKNASKNS